MLSRGVATAAFLVWIASLAAPTPAQAQEIFTYMSHWTLPRASFAAASEFNEKQSVPDFERLVADGTILHWGVEEPFVHAPGGHTHGSWFAATSLEAIDKVMGSFTSASTPNPIPGASEAHHDHLLISLAHGGKTANIRNGYVRTNILRVKPGMNDEWLQHAKASFTPVFDALVADGTILVWEISADAIHSGDPQARYIWYVTADAAGVDKVNAALAEDRAKRPGPTAAMRAASDRDGHRDGLSRTHFQHK